MKTNTVMMTFHAAPAATIGEGTKMKILALKVFIARVDNILRMQVPEMQKIAALFQDVEPFTKQYSGFNNVDTRVMNFTNNASMEHETTTNPHANVLSDKESFHSDSEEHHDQKH